MLEDGIYFLIDIVTNTFTNIYRVFVLKLDRQINRGGRKLQEDKKLPHYMGPPQTMYLIKNSGYSALIQFVLTLITFRKRSIL